MAILEVTKITKAFGGVAALSNADISVEQGTVKALIGPNGAGKTTLFNCISGHIRPDAGEVRVGGKNLTGVPPFVMAEHGLTRTFQNLELFADLSVIENVLVGRHIRMPVGAISAMLRLPRYEREERRARDGAMVALERVGIAELAECAVGSLPYGKQRLVEIARALATEPIILLLDEPAAGLSAGEADELKELVLQIIDEGVAVVLVEHDMRTVMSLAHEITVLDAGRVIAVGPPEKIQNDPEVIAAYLGTDVTDVNKGEQVHPITQSVTIKK
ncbi:MAG: ABC transporter ATP-binding protein [Actinobacteria bacterium]|jgi:branched-chain amino acid transport system ATP-binding protein|nr:ABC transporter ATP-binding protein [Actinomycetota bacterium]MCL6095135.1 ABC transporter ATP-binding protein [Actinomycetota bacterium]